MPEGVPIYGKALAELRWLRCMSQTDLSNACEVNGWRVPRELVSAYELGKKSPTPQNLAAIAKALALSRIEMRALVRTPTLDAATSNGNPGEEDGADRRTAGKIVALEGLSVALPPWEVVERIVTHGDRPVDSGLITAHEDLADALAQLHYTSRPDVLGDQVAHHADRLSRLLERSMSGADRRRLDKVAVGSHAQAGLLRFADGDRVEARRHFALARDVAEDSGNDTLNAQAVGVSSILRSSLPAGGQGGTPGRAVKLLRRAVVQAPDDDTRAWVGWWLAPELAADGDERGFHQMVDTAERFTVRAGHTDGRGFFARCFCAMTPAQMGGNVGQGLVLLGRANEGVDALETLLESSPPRWQAVMRIDTAAARVLQGEPEQACQELALAIGLALDAGYPIGIERARGVRARFPPHWAKLSCVVELDEQLRLAMVSLQRQR